MTEYQFYLRLFITLLLGIALIFVMVKFARRSSSTDAKTHIIFKILGWILIAFGIVSGIIFIGILLSIEHPSVMNEIGSYVVRPTTAKLYWGFPTFQQGIALSNFLNLFIEIAYGLYFIRFRPSSTSWWIKLLKVVSLIIMYFLICSIPDLHYFDWWELWPSLMLVFIIFLNFYLVHENPFNYVKLLLVHNNIIECEDVIISESSSGTHSSEIIFEKEDVKL